MLWCLDVNLEGGISFYLLGCTETESDSLPTNEGITTKIYVYSTKTYITCRLYKHVFHTVKSHLVTTSL